MIHTAAVSGRPDVHPLNRCRLCGASSYRPVIDRDASGALRPNGLYRCSGCSVVFTDPAVWRDGDSQPWPASARQTLPPARGRGPAPMAQAQNRHGCPAVPGSTAT